MRGEGFRVEGLNRGLRLAVGVQKVYLQDY